MKYKIAFTIIGITICLTACGSSSNKEAENVEVMNYIETNTDSEETSAIEESTADSNNESEMLNMDSLEALAESAKDALASISENRYQDGEADDDIIENNIDYNDPDRLVLTEDGYMPLSEVLKQTPKPSTSQPKPSTQTPAQTEPTTWVDPDTGKTWVFTPNDPSKNRDDITEHVELGPEFQGTFIE